MAEGEERVRGRGSARRRRRAGPAGEDPLKPEYPRFGWGVGFVRDLLSDGLALPPPPPPPGTGKTVAWYAVTRRGFRYGQLKFLVVALAIVALLGLQAWPWDRGDLLFLLILALAWWLLIVTLEIPPAVSAGEDWLRVYPSASGKNKDSWVRTDRLTRVEQVFVGWLRPALRLTDEERRTVTVELGDLRANPEVFEVFCRAARRAYQEGRLKGIKPGLVRQLGLDGQ